MVAGGAFWLLQRQAETGGGGGGAGPGVAPVAPAEKGNLERTLRLTGTTEAEKYVNLTSPRLRGSRSRRGATASGSIGVSQGIQVTSSSSVALQTTMSSLSQSGMVASSSGAARAGGGVSQSAASGGALGRASSASGRLGGSSTGGTSAGHVQLVGSGSAGAMGSSGLGSTAAYLTGGSSGPPSSGGRRRGDFSLSLQKVAAAGSWVKKGDVIAEFDRQYMETRLDDYEASVAQQKSSYRKSQAEVKVTRDAHDRSIKDAQASLEKAKLDIKTIPVLSQIQAERTRIALTEADASHRQLLSDVPDMRISEQAALEQSLLEVKEAEVELRRARTNVDKLLIKAPIDGMVVLLNVFRNGEFGQVRAGDDLHSGQPFIQIVDTSSMVVNAMVNQVDVEKLRIGQRAQVRFDAFPDLVLPAHVYSIGTVAKSRRFRKDFVTEIPVRLRLDRTEKRVIPDLSVSADVVIEEDPEVVRVPLEAVHFDSQNNRSYVYVKSGDGFVRRAVELGPRNNLTVAVRSGLKPGEDVALSEPVNPGTKP